MVYTTICQEKSKTKQNKNKQTNKQTSKQTNKQNKTTTTSTTTTTTTTKRFVVLRSITSTSDLSLFVLLLNNRMSSSYT